MIKGILVRQQGDKGIVARFFPEQCIECLCFLVHFQEEKKSTMQILTGKTHSAVHYQEDEVEWVEVNGLPELWQKVNPPIKK